MWVEDIIRMKREIFQEWLIIVEMEINFRIIKIILQQLKEVGVIREMLCL
jgi:hypothetical protein